MQCPLLRRTRCIELSTLHTQIANTLYNAYEMTTFDIHDVASMNVAPL